MGFGLDRPTILALQRTGHAVQFVIEASRVSGHWVWVVLAGPSKAGFATSARFQRRSASFTAPRLSDHLT